MRYQDYDESEAPTSAMLRFCQDGGDGPGVYVFSPIFGWAITGLIDERTGGPRLAEAQDATPPAAKR